jgi:hypothetical protein
VQWSNMAASGAADESSNLSRATIFSGLKAKLSARRIVFHIGKQEKQVKDFVKTKRIIKKIVQKSQNYDCFCMSEPLFLHV